jgi:hypothetical protein
MLLPIHVLFLLYLKVSYPILFYFILTSFLCITLLLSLNIFMMQSPTPLGIR